MLRSVSALRRSARTTFRIPAFAVAAFLSACGGSDTPDIPSNPAVEVYASSLGVTIANMTKKTDALFVQDLVVGTGADAVVGKTLRMQYSGYLINGTKFDSNVGATALTLVLGNGDVIAGWDLGLQGMKVGGKRKLVIGSALAYGRNGRGSIPANATLVFDVELLGLQ